jgi:hypothetical protein
LRRHRAGALCWLLEHAASLSAAVTL